MELRCDVCDITLDSQKLMDEHLSGKAHQNAVARQEEEKKIVSRSVYLAGFKHSVTEAQIRQVFETSGQIERIILDKYGGKFAILEFSDPEVVTKLLAQKTIRIGGDKITMKKRKVDLGKKGPEKVTGHVQSEIIKLVQALHSDNVKEHLRRICAQFRLDPTHIVTQIVPQLLAYMQDYFADQIDLIIFGSTKTNLAFYSSDVDLCFLSKKPTQGASNGQANLLQGTIDLMSQNITDLRSSKIHLSTFNDLSKPDRIKLLTRILNEFRKETSLITSLTAVPDARTPIIRFTYTNAVQNLSKSSVGFEISIDNYLGIHKSWFIRKALNLHFTSVLFLILLWAHCFKLFGDPVEPKGHWSSYALSLIFVHFCQLQGYVTEVRTTGTETVDGWLVGYEMSNTPGKPHKRKFLLEFFEFLVSTFNQKPVLSVRHGKVYKPNEFIDAFDERVKENFKFSLVNVQDPIELSHNVTQNVSDHYLKLLKSQCMRVICNLKANLTQPVLALFAEKSTKSPSVPSGSL